MLLTLFSVRLSILFSFWNNGFYSAMQKLDAKAFWFLLLIFGTLAVVYVARALLSFYVQQSFLIRWRVWLTNDLMERWLGSQSYYRSQYVPERVDNPDQRIQQDVDSFVSSSLSLSVGLLDAVVSLFSFTLILWGLSGTLQLFGVQIPRAMVFLVYAYVLVATICAVRIGRPLIRLSFLNERLNANFRYSLIRLREYGESIAFYRGETVERADLGTRFGELIRNTWAILFRSLKFQGFNFSVSQAAVVFPFIVQAPRLLSKQITLGDVTQTAQAFGQVQDALSFFRSSYDEFASYRAVLERLSGFLDMTESTKRLASHARVRSAGDRLELASLTVRTPTGARRREGSEPRAVAGLRADHSRRIRHRQDHVASGDCGALAVCRRHYRAARRRARAVPAAEAVSAARDVARLSLLSHRGTRRAGGCGGPAALPSRALDRSAGRSRGLGENPVARRATASRDRTSLVEPSARGVPRRMPAPRSMKDWSTRCIGCCESPCPAR